MKRTYYVNSIELVTHMTRDGHYMQVLWSEYAREWDIAIVRA